MDKFISSDLVLIYYEKRKMGLGKIILFIIALIIICVAGMIFITERFLIEDEVYTYSGCEVFTPEMNISGTLGYSCFTTHWRKYCEIKYPEHCPKDLIEVYNTKWMS